MLRRIMIFLTSLLLLLNSALVNASIGGWTLSNPTAVGASILYDGTKGSATSSILISPNASQVAKVLRGGIAGYALTFAVEQLLGAVDWVLDPANNRVSYKDRDPLVCTSQAQCSAYLELWVFYGFNGNNYSSDISALCRSIAPAGYTYKSYSFQMPNVVDCINSNNDYPHLSNTNSIVVIYKVPNPAYNPNVKPEEKYLSLITAAQQVIENAESDNLDAQFAVLVAATNILSEAEQDDAKAKPVADELDNNAKCPSGIVRNGSCWVCDKSLFMPYTRATRDAKNATRGKSCKNVTDTSVKAANATLFRNLINARVQENACWSPPDPNHVIALTDAQNALSLCEN